jgi:acyl-CoA synthetase (AMP-forming)/AMP-acid ligase II
MTLNIAERIAIQAQLRPDAKAVIAPVAYAGRRRTYAHLTFAQLDALVDRYARGLSAIGIQRGMRVLLLVRPSLDFFALTFALFRLGAPPVMLDPAMGRASVLGAIGEVEPDAMIGIPKAHLAKLLFPRFFRSVRVSVVVGPRLVFGGSTLDDVARAGEAGSMRPAPTAPKDTAAILFTSGSTGAPKGVVYTHGIFDAQVRIFEETFGIEAGEVDLSAFPLFSLFSVALGVTVVIPDMDPTKAAAVDPAKILEAIDDHGVTYAFGSPAFWHRIAEHAEAHGTRFRSLARIMMAGAPAPVSLLERLLRALPDGGDVYTPYGATECLPITLPSARALLAGPAHRTRKGEGTCVGRPIEGLEVRIIRITEDALPRIEDAVTMGPGEVGEILVHGPATTESYFRREDDTARSKIRDGERIWHRMGDVGYLDAEGQLWFCGRKSHRVETREGPMYTEECEPIFNAHPRVFRTALVGLGPRGAQKPVVVVECKAAQAPRHRHDSEQLVAELAALAKTHELTRSIETFLFHPAFPVDARHNAKIRREDLAVWAERVLR